MMAVWPEFHRDDAEGLSERRQAISLHALVQEQWRRDFTAQRPELRKQPRHADGEDD